MSRRSRIRSNRGEHVGVDVGLGFIVFWIFCFLFSVGFLGVMVWAIIELVQWVTTK